MFDDAKYKHKSHLSPNYLVTMNTPGLGETLLGQIKTMRLQNFVHTVLC